MVQGFSRGSDIAFQAIASGLARADEFKKRREQENLRNAELAIRKQQASQQTLANIAKLRGQGFTVPQLRKLGVPIPEGADLPKQTITTVRDILGGSDAAKNFPESVLNQPATNELMRSLFTGQQIKATVPTIEKKELDEKIEKLKKERQAAENRLRNAKNPLDVKKEQEEDNEKNARIREINQRTEQSGD